MTTVIITSIIPVLGACLNVIERKFDFILSTRSRTSSGFNFEGLAGTDDIDVDDVDDEDELFVIKGGAELLFNVFSISIKTVK